MFIRPQPVTIPMVLLFAIVPVYLYIGGLVSQWTLHSPELPLDRALPLLPSWSVVYGSLFLAALLPVFVVHQQELVRRTIHAYLTIWLVSYVCFLAYPTIAPTRAAVIEEDFFSWVLQLIYSSDVEYNCFPSLHVAQCFLAALTCYRVHRSLGVVAGVWASLVGMPTLFTKQHYIVDVIAGAVLAYAAYLAFLRGYPREAVPELERRLAPVLALGAFGLYRLLVVGLWLSNHQHPRAFQAESLKHRTNVRVFYQEPAWRLHANTAKLPITDAAVFRTRLDTRSVDTTPTDATSSAKVVRAICFRNGRGL